MFRHANVTEVTQQSTAHVSFITACAVSFRHDRFDTNNSPARFRSTSLRRATSARPDGDRAARLQCPSSAPACLMSSHCQAPQLQRCRSCVQSRPLTRRRRSGSRRPPVKHAADRACCGAAAHAAAARRRATGWRLLWRCCHRRRRVRTPEHCRGACHSVAAAADFSAEQREGAAASRAGVV